MYETIDLAKPVMPIALRVNTDLAATPPRLELRMPAIPDRSAKQVVRHLTERPWAGSDVFSHPGHDLATTHQEAPRRLVLSLFGEPDTLLQPPADELMQLSYSFQILDHDAWHSPRKEPVRF